MKLLDIDSDKHLVEGGVFHPIGVGFVQRTRSEPTMHETIVNDTQVISDGKTVWVNASDGSCIGRFSHFGIDVHTTVTAQANGAPECLDCAHGLPPIESWDRFRASMATHYCVDVGEDHCPAFVLDAAGTAPRI